MLTFSLFAACTPQETTSTPSQDVIRSSGQSEANVSADGSDSVQGVPSDTDVPVSTRSTRKTGKTTNTTDQQNTDAADVTPEVLDDPSVGLIDGWLYFGVPLFEAPRLHFVTFNNRFDPREYRDSAAPQEWKKTFGGVDYTFRYAKSVRLERSDLQEHVYYDEGKRPAKQSDASLTPEFRIDAQTGAVTGLANVAYQKPSSPTAAAYRGIIRALLGDNVNLNEYEETVWTTYHGDGGAVLDANEFYTSQHGGEDVIFYRFVYTKYRGAVATASIQAVFSGNGSMRLDTVVLSDSQAQLFPVLTQTDLDALGEQILKATRSLQDPNLRPEKTSVHADTFFLLDGRPYLGVVLKVDAWNEEFKITVDTAEYFIVDLQAWSKK